jgi:uncharacterized protein (TIGR03067 family)
MSYLVGALLMLCGGQDLFATDYLIQVKTAGYQIDLTDRVLFNAPQIDEPADQVFQTLQVVARVGVPFRARATSGVEVLSIDGMLDHVQGDVAKLSVTMSEKYIDGPSYLNRMGGQELRFGRSNSSFSNDFHLRNDLNTRRVAGGTISQTKSEKENVRKKRQFELRISEFKPGEPTPAEIEAEDALELRGTWETVEAIRDGQVLQDNARKVIGFDCYNNQFSFRGLERELGTRAGFQLDVYRTPKSIEFVPLEGPLKGKKISAIYELKDFSSLTLCIPGKGATDAPTEFNSVAGSGQTLIQFRGIVR